MESHNESDWPHYAKMYLEYERVEANRKFIQNLINDNQIDKLKRLVGTRLLFGTAGIRGQMGPGFGQMNDLVIIQTSQGLASYLLESVGEKLCKEQGVIIGHDARHNSSRFARLTALAFLQKGIPVYYSDHIVPTPLIAFGVKYYSCSAGIVITASHNPKNDNGYKVFWTNGAQILSPHDKNIQMHIERPENQIPWPRAWQHELLTPDYEQLPPEWDEILLRIHNDLTKSYFAYIEQLVGDRRDRNRSSELSITYTPMHGVGHMFLSKALDIAGFEEVYPVERQKKPDPEFPTVRFPNPEEAGALDLAFETAKHSNSRLILANDPDADRCAAALFDPLDGYRRVLTGNEIGALLGWWSWFCYQTGEQQRYTITTAKTTEEEGHHQSTAAVKHATSSTTSSSTGVIATPPVLTKQGPEDHYMLSTAVSSKFLKSMAQKEGFKFIETLTGFKYMGNKADELIKQGKRVLFAYEEAIGYMVDTQILDKDGISAAIQLAQCAAYVSTSFQRTLEDQLDWLYLNYGYHYNLNSYYLCNDQQKIRKIFHRLQSNFPKSFVSNESGKKEEFVITRIRDLNCGFDSGTEDKKPTLPISTSSFMVTFFIGDEITFTIRTSGTEPKIKYYSEIIAKLPPNDLASKLQIKFETQERLRRFVNSAVERCLEPRRNHLEPAN